MTRFLKIVGSLVGLLVVVASGVLLWAYLSASRAYNRTWASHDVAFDLPFPLHADEVAVLSPGSDAQAIALDRAVQSGRRLVETRYSCKACHGPDLGGATLIDSPVVGVWGGPNLTTGRGSVTLEYTPRDWDRAVRHGIRRSGKTSAMPVTEFRSMSDHELSDIVAYVRSLPPVDRAVRPVTLGPVLSFVVATDTNAIGTAAIDHDAPHAKEPPALAASVELGRHIAQVCTGCHGSGFSGGTVAGDPNMPVVANLTPHETGLKGWTEADFVRSMREGRRKDGSAIKPQMPWEQLGQMSDTELGALWAFLQTLPPVEKGNH